MTDELFLGKKKNKLYFFFSRFAEKKNTRFSDLNEWMTNVHVRVKKKYGTFAGGYDKRLRCQEWDPNKLEENQMDA